MTCCTLECLAGRGLVGKTLFLGLALIDTLKAEVGGEFVAIVDQSGSVADRFGIEVWPTTLSVDGTGIVSDVMPGGQASY